MGVPAPLGVSASGRSPYWPHDEANGVIQGTFAAVLASVPFQFMGPLNLWLYASFTSSLAITSGSLSATIGAAGAVAAGTAISSTLLPKGTTMSAIGGGGGVTLTLVLPIYTYWAKTKVGFAKITDIPDTEWLLGAAVTGPGIPANTTVSAIDVPSVQPSVYDPKGVRGTVTISNNVTAATDDNSRAPFTFAIDDGVLTSGTDSAAVFTGGSILFHATVQLERSFDGGSIWLPCNIGSGGTLAKWIGDGSATGVPISISFGEPENMVLYRLNCLAYTGITSTDLNFRISETGQAAKTLSVPTLS